LHRFLLGFALCLLTAGATRAQDKRVSIVTNPDWEVRPSAESIDHYYPPLAALFAMPGYVRMTCEVKVDHTLTKCFVLSESPAGLGFGAAALEMASTFRMKPETRDGEPVGGASVTIPIPFSIADDEDAEDEPKVEVLPDLIKPIDPTSKALALRLVRAGESMDRNASALQAAFDATLRESLSRPGVDPQVVSQLSLATNSATQSLISQMIEQRAEYFAKALGPEETKAALAFFESDAGKAFVSAQYGRMTGISYAEAIDRVRKQVVEQFCATRPCPPEKP
jgi:TonB family protein